MANQKGWFIIVLAFFGIIDCADAKTQWMKPDEFLFCRFAGTNSKMTGFDSIQSSWEGDEWLGDGTDAQFINEQFEHIMVGFRRTAVGHIDFMFRIFATDRTIRFQLEDESARSGRNSRITKELNLAQFRSGGPWNMSYSLEPKAGDLFAHFLIQCHLGKEADRKR